jgi:hypothetical protein
MLIAAQTVIQYWINNICSTNQSMLLQLTSSKKKRGTGDNKPKKK